MSHNKEKILKMLMEKELTVKEIAQDLNLKENAVNVYISRLKKERLIERIGKKNRYNIYATIKKEQNKESYSLDTKILKKLIKPFVEHGIEIDLETNEINRIKELCSYAKLFNAL